MAKQTTAIQKCAWGFAFLFLGVYALDYVPGIMDKNNLIFGLFHMTRIVDLGHLAAGTLAALGAWISERAARVYFWLLGIWYTLDVVIYFFMHLHTSSFARNVAVNTPHILIFIAAYWIALRVGVRRTAA